MITEDELAAIMADHARYADPWEYRDLAETVADHVPALVAEVRRLQAVEAAALALAREDATIPGLREGTVTCFFCDGADSYTGETGHAPEPLKHTPDCPYVALWAALGFALAGDAATAGPATGG